MHHKRGMIRQLIILRNLGTQNNHRVRMLIEIDLVLEELVEESKQNNRNDYQIHLMRPAPLDLIIDLDPQRI